MGNSNDVVGAGYFRLWVAIATALLWLLSGEKHTSGTADGSCTADDSKVLACLARAANAALWLASNL